MRSGRKFNMGDKVRIKVVAANLTKRQLDYEWVITTSMKEDQGDVQKHMPRPIPQPHPNPKSRKPRKK
jgi:ribonuclease R